MLIVVQEKTATNVEIMCVYSVSVRRWLDIGQYSECMAEEILAPELTNRERLTGSNAYYFSSSEFNDLCDYLMELEQKDDEIRCDINQIRTRII